MRIGVISDTHGHLDPRAAVALRGVAHILHAGDIGDPAIIGTLAAIAPITAVYGNVDIGTALGRRYSGGYVDENGGGVLPRVSRWAIWNDDVTPTWCRRPSSS